MRGTRVWHPAVLLGVIVFLLATTTAQAERRKPLPELELTFDETFHQTYPLPSDGTFSLSNVNGSVKVEGWERDEVEVHAVKTAKKNQSDLKLVRIEVKSEPKAVQVRTRYPEDEGVEVNVEYRIRVPYHALLEHVDTVNGTIRVRGIEGKGDLRSVNGNVEVEDSAGGFSARTTNGNVQMELRQLAHNASMNIETVNGSVLLALPADSDADLDVRSMNGEFSSELPVAQPGFLSREFHGRVGHGGGAVRIRTVNGGIQVVTARPTI